MEYFSISVLAFFALIIAFLVYGKAKGLEVPKYSDSEFESKISKIESWIDWYHRQPERNKNEELKRKYFQKYIELREMQIEQSRVGANRKDINYGEGGVDAILEHIDVLKKEVELVKSGVDPEEARFISSRGTRFEKAVDMLSSTSRY
ncbi:MAG: hypothetical protein U5L98_05765 [Halomonas sp.]|uniref:hypothetical protein n=1 Tax=Halomonas sp. TaxID=1486246 RepID=UPI002ACD672D|nr:hypothetical protein [Halomonas sp.]MDZ7852158.1 hypothetical protein [Halomonas sp.]